MLNGKREAFARAVALHGLNQSDAYRAHYSTGNMKETTIHEAASHLAATVKVSTRIAQLQRDYQVMDQKEFVAEAKENIRLGRELHQIGASNGALQLAGKASGLLIDKVEHSGDITHHLMPNLSLDQLQALVAKAEAEALELGLNVMDGEVIDGEVVDESAPRTRP